MSILLFGEYHQGCYTKTVNVEVNDMTEETTEETVEEPTERTFTIWDRQNSPVCSELREEHNDAVKKIDELQAQLERSSISISQYMEIVDISRARLQSIMNTSGESAFKNVSNSRGQWLGTVYLFSGDGKLAYGKNWQDGLLKENKRANDNERMIIKLKELLIKEHCQNCKDFSSGRMKCSSNLCREFKKEFDGTPYTISENDDDQFP